MLLAEFFFRQIDKKTTYSLSVDIENLPNFLNFFTGRKGNASTEIQKKVFEELEKNHLEHAGKDILNADCHYFDYPLEWKLFLAFNFIVMFIIPFIVSAK